MLRTLVVTASLAAVAILAASGRHVYDLHARYQVAESARPVAADFDFMYMAIATHDVQTYTKAERGAFKPAGVIPQWQRCVVDGAWCDSRPKQAHMRCKEGIVYVNEQDWRAFSLIQQESLPGAVAMNSMNLCALGNVPDE